jgi:TolB-like protein/tetratricopeptide (TPR) repeat protein
MYNRALLDGPGRDAAAWADFCKRLRAQAVATACEGLRGNLSEAMLPGLVKRWDGMAAIPEFAHKFGLVLKACNLSRGRLAQAVGIDKSVVSRWASGVQAPTDHNLALLTEAVGRHRPGFARADWELPSKAFAARLGLDYGSPAGEPALALPERPSIAVLPFTNMSGDPEQEYFADGMVEEIITSLSRSQQMFVIARNSSFTYKGKSPDIRQVGRELGVRYVLEGSVRKSGNRVRITGQLIDASNGRHIWADRFDGNLDDIFELQDQVTSSVVGGIFTPLANAEMKRARRKVGDLQAYDFFLRSWAAGQRFTAEGTADALALVREAIALAPDFALNHALLASLLHRRLMFGLVVPTGDLEEAERAARLALDLDSNDPRVLAWCGQTLVMMLGRLPEGAALLDQAVRIAPNFAMGLISRGSARIALGEPEKATGDVERALRLSPIDPHRYYAFTLLARAHTLCGRYDKALPLVAESLRLQPNFPGAVVEATVAHALIGDLDSARQYLANYERMLPGARIERFRHRATHLSAAGIEKYVEGLRLAGLPE